MYAIVEFIAEKNVDMIPKSWLNSNNLCFWPPSHYKAHEISTYIKRQKIPEDDWKQHGIKVLGEATTFQEARKKLRKAQSESELSTDVENYGRGKRRKRSKFSDSSSSEDERSNSLLNNVICNLPSPPNVMVESDLSNAEDSYSLSSRTSDFFKGSASPHVIRAREAENIQSPCSSRVAAVEHKSNFSIEEVLKPLVKELRIVKTMLRNNSEILKTLMETTNRLTEIPLNQTHESFHENTRPEILDINFPLSAEEELLKAENLLCISHNVDKLNEILQRIGGTSLGDETRRMLRYIIVDEFAEKFNWHGTKGKQKFSSLKICKIIIDAIIKKRENACRAEVENAIKAWLRHAKEREMYSKRQKEKRNAV